MKVEPTYESFAAGYGAGRPSVVYTRLVADLETPVSAMLKLADGKAYSFLLESVEGGAVRGRYSLIGLKPDLLWRCSGDRPEINRRFRIDEKAFQACQGGGLASLRALVEECRIELPPGLPPMTAGLFGYMGYDMVRLMEDLPTDKPPGLGLPDSVFLRPTVMAIFDNVEDLVTIVTPVWPSAEIGPQAAYNQACERLADTVADFGRNLPERREVLESLAELPEPSSNMPPDRFHAMVGRAKEYILAGDIFQVVLSQRFQLPFTLPPFSLYRALRRLNPSPFLFFLDLGGFAIVGSSPEILVRLRDGTVTIRPIAGTRVRGKTDEEDKALAEELMSDPKERAEHLMLVDLGRNDVGRVAKTGEVRVTDSFFIERYSHVMHLVSNVEGRIRDGLDAVDALAAGLPAGTLSGAPKIRAMQLIDEFEKEKRGAVYAGAVGYFAADGSMDTCIVLRTALVKDGTMYVQAGGGVVADSVPEAEYQETVNKAKALMTAADEAVRYASASRKGQ